MKTKTKPKESLAEIEKERREWLLELRRIYMKEYRAGKRRRDKK